MSFTPRREDPKKNQRQLFTYLKLRGPKLGFLLNLGFRLCVINAFGGNQAVQAMRFAAWRIFPFNEHQQLSRRHPGTEMKEKEIGTQVVDCVVAIEYQETNLDEDGFLNPDPPCLNASVREKIIAPCARGNAAPPRALAERSMSTHYN